MMKMVAPDGTIPAGARAIIRINGFFDTWFTSQKSLNIFKVFFFFFFFFFFFGFFLGDRTEHKSERRWLKLCHAFPPLLAFIKEGGGTQVWNWSGVVRCLRYYYRVTLYRLLWFSWRCWCGIQAFGVRKLRDSCQMKCWNLTSPSRLPHRGITLSYFSHQLSLYRIDIHKVTGGKWKVANRGAKRRSRLPAYSMTDISSRL